MDKHRELIAELVTEHCWKIAEWKESQVVELIEQLIKSGDLVQHTQAGLADRYGVTYLPYREKQELKSAADKLAGFVGWYSTTKHGPQCDISNGMKLCTCGVDIAKDLIKDYRGEK